MLPRFYGIAFYTLIAARSVLTMACELVGKKKYDIGSQVLNPSFAIYLAGCLWTSFLAPP